VPPDSAPPSPSVPILPTAAAGATLLGEHLAHEAARYLDAVALFAAEGCDPHAGARKAA
jgi:hypothetical protein